METYDEDLDEVVQSYVALAHQLEQAASGVGRDGYGQELRDADSGMADTLRDLARVVRVWEQTGGNYPDKVRLTESGPELDPVMLWADAVEEFSSAESVAREVLVKVERERGKIPWDVVSYANLMVAAAAEVKTTAKP